MSNRTADTICAISTPSGVGGIAVVRLSGSSAKLLAEKHLKNATRKEITLSDHRAKLASFYGSGEFIDDVVATYFAAPRSYTGEDVVELSCHGSLYVQHVIVRCLLDSGARLAEPGEFTMRAFLNGRLDLSQAEAVADLIDSRSHVSHRLAVSQLRGGYANQLEQLRQEFVDLAALLELELDFSDEDLEFANREHLKQLVVQLKSKVQRLVDSFQTGNALKNGVPVAIVGRPNVGKSTLLNALLNDNRAIVSDQAGTTRDTIEEQFIVRGIVFRLIDTAGLRHTDNSIEQAGIERSINAMRQASIILYMVDATEDDSSVSMQIEELLSKVDLQGKTLVLLRNKIDKVELSNCAGIIKHDNYTELSISAKSNLNLEALLDTMVDSATRGKGEDDVLLTNIRHYEAMQHVLAALDEVQKGMDAGLTPDLIVVDIRDALYHLGTITGKVSSEDVLSSVFTRFCIGK